MSVPREDLDPRAQRAIELFENSPVGEQLSEPKERSGRCWRASTRFLSALRESDLDGSLLVWVGEGWEHGAILLDGTDIVVDWTASQFAEDDEEAAAYDFPCIRTRGQADAELNYESYVLDFEDPFQSKAPNLIPEPLLRWERARQRIVGTDEDARHRG
jgi:hypothetical protein